jgi:hypothetical protein
VTLTTAMRAVDGTDRGIRRSSWPAAVLVRVHAEKDEWQGWSGFSAVWANWHATVLLPSDVLAEDWEVQP